MKLSLLKTIAITFTLSMQASALDWYATDFDEVNKTICREKLPTQWEMDEFAAEQLKPGIRKYSDDYFNFVAESKESIEIYRRLVRPFNLKKIVGHKLFKNKIKAAQKCNSIECALLELFESQEVLTKVIYIVSKYELNTSAYYNVDAAQLTSDQLDIVLRAIRLVPKKLMPLKKNKRLVRHINETIGYRHKSMIYANASIELYAPWVKELDQDGKTYALFHEFAHNLGYKDNLGRNYNWWKLSDWIDHPMGWRYDRSKMISKYGASNPSEDAAESIVAYRLDPHKLKKIAPLKYNYLKKHIFDGVEFTSSKACAN